MGATFGSGAMDLGKLEGKFGRWEREFDNWEGEYFGKWEEVHF